MDLRPYLPSPKFVVMVGSLACAVGLVLAAQYVTRPQQTQLSADTVSSVETQAQNWQQSLEETVAQSGVDTLKAPDPTTVGNLLTQASSPNLTTEVGRNLLINLSSESAQGLGQDSPTQDQLIAQAAEQINASASSTVYTSAQLAVVAPSNAALTAYGNAAMAALEAHPDASAQATYLAIGQATDAQNSAPLAALSTIGKAYGAIAHDLLDTPVPQTLAPLHLQLINDYQAMADSYADMQALVSDPLRGIAAVQRYSSAMDEAQRVLTSIAQTLNKDGILFTKDEPGATWSAFLSS